MLVESRADDGTEGFDIPGAVTVTAGLALLVYGVVEAVNVGWGSIDDPAAGWQARRRCSPRSS